MFGLNGSEIGFILFQLIFVFIAWLIVILCSSSRRKND